MKLDALRTAATSLALILCVTAAARLAFAWHQARKIPPEQIGRVVFQTEAANIARSLALGKGFSSPYTRETGPTAILPPVYPLLVAAVFKVFGVASRASFYALILLNIVFATLTCIPIRRVALRIGGLATASTAAWLWALFPNGIVIPFEWIWDTSLSALLAATLLWLTIELWESVRLRHWAAYGLLSGLALMANPALGAALPVMLGWAAWRARKKRRIAMSRPALAAALAVLCCAPWTLRNFAVFHRFIPLRSGFGFELYIGNNENYDDQVRVWPPRVTFERELVRYIHMGEMPFMDEERRKAVAFMTSHPRIACGLFGKRIVDFWFGTAAPVTAFLMHESLLDRFILICNLLLPLLALAGALLLLLRRCEFSIPLLAFPTFFPFIYYLTHTSLRYRHAIDPNLMLLAALALCTTAHVIPGKSRPQQSV